MLRRRFYQDLLAWKNDAASKALLVDGARQIGKTYLVESFAKAEYPDYIKVDFIRDERAAALLGKATNAHQVIERLTLLADKEVVPGHTLVFLDEVQEVPRLVTLVKYLVQDGRFDVVMSGSLLGVEMGGVRSFPVGFLRMASMFPLTFEEFCWSQAVPQGVLDQVELAYEERRPLDEELHSRLVQLFRLYLVIGGMPEAVQKYLDANHDLGAVREVQRDLVALYREDIAKHAKGRAVPVKAIFDALPGQLAKENKRFELRTIASGARFDRYANDFSWLVSARAALKTLNVREPRFMLKRTEEQARFKLYPSDAGMLMVQYPLGVASDVLSGSRDVNYGAVYESVVAQSLAAAGSPLWYYHNNRKGEVDFLLETNQAQVVPLEVKSGKDYKRHVALNNLLQSEEWGIPRAYVLSEGNVSTRMYEGKQVHYLPLYMIDLIAREAARVREDGGASLVVEPPSWQ